MLTQLQKLFQVEQLTAVEHLLEFPQEPVEVLLLEHLPFELPGFVLVVG